MHLDRHHIGWPIMYCSVGNHESGTWTWRSHFPPSRAALRLDDQRSIFFHLVFFRRSNGFWPGIYLYLQPSHVCILDGHVLYHLAVVGRIMGSSFGIEGVKRSRTLSGTTLMLGLEGIINISKKILFYRNLWKLAKVKVSASVSPEIRANFKSLQSVPQRRRRQNVIDLFLKNTRKLVHYHGSWVIPHSNFMLIGLPPSPSLTQWSTDQRECAEIPSKTSSN